MAKETAGRKIERRVAPLELREVDGKKTLAGYAAVFDSWSEDLGGFREIIRRGAFDATLRESPDVFALLDHDSGRVIGRTRNDTLNLSVDKRGLSVEIRPPDTTDGRDTIKLVEERFITQMSFAFLVRGADGAAWNDDLSERELFSVDLFDVSPVSFPAYPDTTIAARSRQLALAERRNLLLTRNTKRLKVIEQQAALRARRARPR